MSVRVILSAVAVRAMIGVSLFAQNSRGRNYIKQNISEWGTKAS